MVEESENNYYEVLESDKNATSEELKKNYQRLALTLHPDKSGELSESFQILHKAWSVLRDPLKRKHYDAELACHEHSELLLYDTISLKEMNCLNNEGYVYSCRCGGTYVLNKTDIVGSKVIVGCDECSFSIEINLL